MYRSVSARLTAALGVLHLAATLPGALASIPGILDRGVFGGISLGIPPLEAAPAVAALFSTLVGVQLFPIASLVDRLEGPPPRVLGWTFLVSGLVGAVLLPMGGFWLLAALGGRFLWQAR